jgi:plastocyanin
VIPTGSKLWYGLSAFAVAACIAYFAVSSGEEYGSVVLASLAMAAFTLGLLSSFLRDGDVEQTAATDVAGPAGTVQPAALWPALGALGVGVAIVGLATGGLLFYVGVAIALAAGIEWAIQAWAERITPDQAANQRLRNRLMYPIEIPVVAALLVGGVIIAFSRVMLALPRTGSTVVAIVVAASILAVAFLLTSRPRLSSSVLTGVAVVGAVVLLGGGIVGAVAGEREFEHHEEESEGEAGGEGTPVTAVITASNVNDYDEDEITVPVGEPVTIQLDNTQLGVQHNVHIVDLEDVPPSEIITGPDQTTFELTIEEPGDYEFICDVHPVMTGVLTAVEQPASDEDEPSPGEEGGGASVDELDGEG